MDDVLLIDNSLEQLIVQREQQRILSEYNLDNGAMIIFTQSNDGGWNFAEGKVLHFRFTQRQSGRTKLTQARIV